MRSSLLLLLAFCNWALAICNTQASPFGPELIVSEADQELALVDDNKVQARYPISTSKFGVGDSNGSYKTPLGIFFVCNKIGDGLASGAVIKNRNFTGEIVKTNAPGRDPIVSRVIWLRGLEERNQNAYERCIYIHGTPEERTIGKKASFGCVRMRSKDVIKLYEQVRIGTKVTIISDSLDKLYPSRIGRIFAISTSESSRFGG